MGAHLSTLSVLSAKRRKIPIFHMEAGLRAWDRRMPEQRNRILIDHISDVLLPYNQYHRENLIREGIHPSKIIVTGNTTFEAMRKFAPQIEASKILKVLNLAPKKYILVTAHRSENVDNREYLGIIFKAMEKRRTVQACTEAFRSMETRKERCTKDTGRLEGLVRLQRISRT